MSRISSVPPRLLSLACPSLWLLDLAANPITADELRSTPHYATFDERRRAKADKQVRLTEGLRPVLRHI